MFTRINIFMHMLHTYQHSYTHNHTGLYTKDNRSRNNLAGTPKVQILINCLSSVLQGMPDDDECRPTRFVQCK